MVQQPAEQPAEPQQTQPAITLKVSDMMVQDAGNWIGKLSDVPITVDARLAAKRVTFQFQDTDLSDALQFLAKITGGEVKPLGKGYQIVPAAPAQDADPVAPSVAQ